MDEPNNKPQVEEAQDVYPLDDAAISVLADLKANIASLDAQWTGALVLFIRQHKLVGNWGVAPNGKELIRRPDPPQELPK
jgi:hypothetical protein